MLRIYTHPEPRKYILSFYGMVDLFSVLPAFIALLFPDAQYLLVVRVIRMLRIFRVLKLAPISAKPTSCWWRCRAVGRRSLSSCSA